MSKRFESDKLIFRGRKAEVHDVTVKLPDGRVIARDFIHFRPAATIVPILNDGRMVLIRNYRFTVEDWLLELPAGAIDEGEAPAAGAARELLEETGYSAGEMELLGEFFLAPGSTDERMYSFAATGLTPGPQKLEAYEQIVVETFAPDEVKQMLADGRIRDGKTIATLALYWQKKGC